MWRLLPLAAGALDFCNMGVTLQNLGAARGVALDGDYMGDGRTDRISAPEAQWFREFACHVLRRSSRE